MFEDKDDSIIPPQEQEAPPYPDWRKDEHSLTNAGLPEEEREWFSDARPQPVKKSAAIIENFFNWARANSLWILAFGTGCGAIELRPLITARYDISRLGMQPRPTPRQANVFMIGGYVSIKTLKRIVRSYEQMQGPKFVVAVCSCAINGGMYWDSYNTVKRIDEYIPVDVYVTGCMPRPEAVLAGFAMLKELILAGKAEGQNLYAEKFDWYKANQKAVIKDWNMPDYNW
ncbi:MAG: NADH-quinone oxidoreductase subunit NuoB [Candidatus Cloacimonadaceae bacterium]|nr:NADH-quinone oxidoreductase subunit NuoB [Candidatus Cloacimonadaceae bacterium]